MAPQSFWRGEPQRVQRKIQAAVFVPYAAWESLDEARLSGVQQQTKGINRSEDSTFLLSTEQHHVRKHKTLKRCNTKAHPRDFWLARLLLCYRRWSCAETGDEIKSGDPLVRDYTNMWCRLLSGIQLVGVFFKSITEACEYPFYLQSLPLKALVQPARP